MNFYANVTRQLLWENYPSTIRVCTTRSSRPYIRLSQHHRRMSDSCTWQYLPSSSVIDVTPLADSLRSRVREYTRKENLKLVGILANEGSQRLDAQIYSDRIRSTFLEDEIDYEVVANKEPKIQWIKDQIQLANEREDVHGTLIFYPIHPYGPKGPYKCRLTGVYYKTLDDHLRDLVHPSKDVEGLCGTKWFKVRDSRRKEPPPIYPCTSLSVLRILEEY